MYGKTFTTLWEGSMVGQADVQLVFIFLFCHCDWDGFVEAHPAIISAKTGLSLSRVRAALKVLGEPDPDSRSKAEDGRRIVAVDVDHAKGWHVVNYKHYRELRDSEERRKYHRDYWHKRKHSTPLNQTQPDSTTTQPHSTHVDVEVDVEEEVEGASTCLPASEVVGPSVESTEVAPSPSVSPPADSVFQFPTNRRGQFYGVSSEQIVQFQALYPAVDVMQQLRSALGWTISEPTKRKTIRGMPAFLNRWLAREQNRDHGRNGQRGSGKMTAADLMAYANSRGGK